MATRNATDWHRTDLSDLVTVTEMAKRAGKPVPQMSNMATKTKGFPKALNAPGIAGRVYVWPEVKDFLDSRKSETADRKLSQFEMLQKQMQDLQKDLEKLGKTA